MLFAIHFEGLAPVLFLGPGGAIKDQQKANKQEATFEASPMGKHGSAASVCRENDDSCILTLLNGVIWGYESVMDIYKPTYDHGAPPLSI